MQWVCLRCPFGKYHKKWSKTPPLCLHRNVILEMAGQCERHGLLWRVSQRSDSRKHHFEPLLVFCEYSFNISKTMGRPAFTSSGNTVPVISSFRKPFFTYCACSRVPALVIGVIPLLLLIFTLAPAPRRVSTTFTRPRKDAPWRAVPPSLVC